mgnify:FL=1
MRIRFVFDLCAVLLIDSGVPTLTTERRTWGQQAQHCARNEGIDLEWGKQAIGEIQGPHVDDGTYRAMRICDLRGCE